MKEGLPMVARIISGFLVLFFGGLVLVPAVCAQTVKVGITSKTLFFLPYYVGQKKGFYATENIRIEPVLIGRSDVQLAALLAGELQIGSLNADATIVINEKGGNLKVIAGVDNSAPYILVGGKAYKKSTISRERESACRPCAEERRRYCWIISKANGSFIPVIFP